MDLENLRSQKVYFNNATEHISTDGLSLARQRCDEFTLKINMSRYDAMAAQNEIIIGLQT